MKILALIPARGGSRRLPGKNLRPFLGRPLLQWSVSFARELGVFDRLLVSTDDEAIAQCGRDAGGEVPYLRAHQVKAAVHPHCRRQVLGALVQASGVGPGHQGSVGAETKDVLRVVAHR